MKIDRQEVYNMCDGHCAYCGKDITLKQMQVDHKEPLFRNSTDKELTYYNRERGKNDMVNLLPSCARCNRWKSTYTIEQFRKEISLQIERLNNYNNNYRMAKDYNLIEETNNPVMFYYEKGLGELTPST
jgi:5-methylcytosine-specific restriction endonuclease McrA